MFFHFHLKYDKSLVLSGPEEYFASTNSLASNFRVTVLLPNDITLSSRRVYREKNVFADRATQLLYLHNFSRDRYQSRECGALMRAADEIRNPKRARSRRRHDATQSIDQRSTEISAISVISDRHRFIKQIDSHQRRPLGRARSSIYAIRTSRFRQAFSAASALILLVISCKHGVVQRFIVPTPAMFHRIAYFRQFVSQLCRAFAKFHVQRNSFRPWENWSNYYCKLQIYTVIHTSYVSNAFRERKL